MSFALKHSIGTVSYEMMKTAQYTYVLMIICFYSSLLYKEVSDLLSAVNETDGSVNSSSALRLLVERPRSSAARGLHGNYTVMGKSLSLSLSLSLSECLSRLQKIMVIEA